MLREAFRVLKPGGRFAVSDVVVRGDVPDVIKKNMELWIGCVAGALTDYEYVAKLARPGFDDIDIEETRVYRLDDARTFLAGAGPRRRRAGEKWTACSSARSSGPQKPAAPTCCGPSCCN